MLKKQWEDENVPSRVLHLTHGISNVACEEGEKHFHALSMLGCYVEARLPVFVRRRKRGAKPANKMVDEYVETRCMQGAKGILSVPGETMQRGPMLRASVQTSVCACQEKSVEDLDRGCLRGHAIV